MATDVQIAYDAIKAKLTPQSTLWDYYDGQQPLVYSTERLAELFRDVNAHFEQNWCAVVVDSALDRISLSGLSVAKDKAATEKLASIWADAGMEIESDDSHLAALVTGEAFVIAWKDDAGMQVFYNDPRMCYVHYDLSNPHIKLWAAKMWLDSGAKKWRMTLYYADRLEYYETDKDKITNYRAFKPSTPDRADNPYKVVPVFHFRLERRVIKSAMQNAIAPQDAVNKLLSDMMVASEFGALKQRYVVSQNDPGNLKNAPNEIWWLPGGDGQGQPTMAGEFSSTDLGNYIKAISEISSSIAIITRTPKHYFFGQGGGTPSGEALIAMEAPLNKKCERYIKRFSATWRELGAFLLQLDGANVDAQAIEAMYENPSTVQPRTRADIRKVSVDSGMPLATVLRREEQWSDADLAQMETDRADDKKQRQSNLAAALLEQQRQFDQGAGEEESDA